MPPAEDATRHGSLLLPSAKFLTFFGPNAGYYLERMREESANLSILARPLRERWGRYTPTMKILWAAVLCPLPWMFYRKLFLPGSALLVALILGSYVSGTASYAIFSMLVGQFGAGLLILRASKIVGRAERSGQSESEQLAFISRHGGVSWTGAAFGALVMVSLSMAAFVPDSLSGRLTCGGETTLRMLRELAAPEMDVSKAASIQVDSIRTLQRHRERVVCVSRLSFGSDRRTVEYELIRVSAETNRFWVKIRSGL